MVHPDVLLGRRHGRRRCRAMRLRALARRRWPCERPAASGVGRSAGGSGAADRRPRRAAPIPEHAACFQGNFADERRVLDPLGVRSRHQRRDRSRVARLESHVTRIGIRRRGHRTDADGLHGRARVGHGDARLARSVRYAAVRFRFQRSCGSRRGRCRFCAGKRTPIGAAANDWGRNRARPQRPDHGTPARHVHFRTLP